MDHYRLEKSHQELHEINQDLEERILDVVRLASSSFSATVVGVSKSSLLIFINPLKGEDQ